MRFKDRAALVAVSLLATWTNVLIQLLFWEGLFIFRDKLHLPVELLNYELSIWPVIIDVIILMATMVLTHQQFKVSEGQQTMLEVQQTMLEAVKTNTEVTRMMVQQMRQQVAEIGEQVEDIHEAMEEDAEKGGAPGEKRPDPGDGRPKLPVGDVP